MPWRSLLLALAVACRSDPAGQLDAAPPDPHDAPDGSGCAATSPRTVAPEPFVGPTGLQARLIALLDGAQSTLEVQMYLFTVTAIADRIVAAHQRGVAVRVILDPDEAANATVRARLAAAQIPHRDATPLYTFSHAKYLVIDRAVAVVMSMNFNVDAMSRERNYGIVDRDPEDVADVLAIFDMDWAAAGNETPRPADLTCTRLVVSPNNARQRVLELINAASTSLDVEALYVTETAVRAAILAAKARGVAVRVILDPDLDTAGTTAVLKAQGIEVHNPSNFLLHAKLLISDGVAFVGSENFSSTSLTRNREVGALVFEPSATPVIQTQFDADWASTPIARR